MYDKLNCLSYCIHDHDKYGTAAVLLHTLLEAGWSDEQVSQLSQGLHECVEAHKAWKEVCAP